MTLTIKLTILFVIKGSIIRSKKIVLKNIVKNIVTPFCSLDN